MLRILLSLAIVVSCFQLSQAQFGISLQGMNYRPSAIEERVATSVYDLQYGLAADYWMRLKNYRWEMVPTVSYTMGQTTSTEFMESSELSLQSLGFHFKNNLYLLDFENDCNCPTFSKQGGWFQKAFFVQVAPGYSMNWLNHSDVASEESEIAHLFELGIGAGFDFGLSDLITISPYFNYVWTNNFEYSYLSSEEETFKGNLQHFVVGLRLGLRPDYARPRTMRRRNLGY